VSLPAGALETPAMSCRKRHRHFAEQLLACDAQINLLALRDGGASRELHARMTEKFKFAFAYD
jgi:hypothetical protein